MSAKGAKGKKLAGKKTDQKEKKSKGKKDENSVTRVDHKFYELTINDLNNKLSRLRTLLEKYEEKNSDLEQKLSDFHADREDVANRLQRLLNEKIEKIRKHEETIEKMEEISHADSVKAAESIQQWEKQYNDMRKYLLSEMKLINGQLASLKEFELIRDELYERYDDLWQEEKDREQMYQDQMFDIQRNILIERDELKANIELKLINLAKDIRLSNEIRNAGYTQRLIRENVALQKEVEALILDHMNLHQEFRRFKEKNQLVHDEYMLLVEMHRHLMDSTNNKVNIIEKLTSNYEHLKSKFIETLQYRKLYEKLIKTENVSTDIDGGTTTQVRDLTRALESLKLEKAVMQAQLNQNESEKEKLQNIIQKIYRSIKLVISNIRDDPLFAHEDEEEEEEGGSKATGRTELRLNLLYHLADIIVAHSSSQPTSLIIATPAAYSQEDIYQKGCVGLIPPASGRSLREIFRKDTLPRSSAMHNRTDPFDIVVEEQVYIPKARTEKMGSIIDVEWGTSFYISSEHEEKMSVDHHDEMDEYAEVGASSSFDTNEPEAKPKVAVSEVTLERMISRSDANIKFEKPAKSEESLQHTDVSHIFSDENDSEEQDEEGEYSTELFY